MQLLRKVRPALFIGLSQIGAPGGPGLGASDGGDVKGSDREIIPREKKLPLETMTAGGNVLMHIFEKVGAVRDLETGITDKKGTRIRGIEPRAAAHRS